MRDILNVDLYTLLYCHVDRLMNGEHAITHNEWKYVVFMVQSVMITET